MACTYGIGMTKLLLNTGGFQFFTLMDKAKVSISQYPHYCVQMCNDTPMITSQNWNYQIERQESPQFLTSRRLCGYTIHTHTHIHTNTLYKYTCTLYIYTHILCTYIQYMSAHLPMFPPTQEVVNLLNFCQQEKQRMLFHLQQHSFYIYSFLVLLGLCCRADFSLAVSRGYFLVVMHGLVIAVASLLLSTGLRACMLQQLQQVSSVAVAPGLWSTGSMAVARELSCSSVGGIFQDQGSNMCLLHWQVGSLPLGHLGSPHNIL